MLMGNIALSARRTDLIPNITGKMEEKERVPHKLICLKCMQVTIK